MLNMYDKQSEEEKNTENMQDQEKEVKEDDAKVNSPIQTEDTDKTEGEAKMPEGTEAT